MSGFQTRIYFPQDFHPREFVVAGAHLFAEIIGEGAMPCLSNQSVDTCLVGAASHPKDMVDQSFFQQYLMQPP